MSISVRIAPKYEGAWDSNKVYKKLSVVVYEENSYIAKVDEVPTGILPTNPDYYELYIDNSSQKTLKEKVDGLETDFENMKTDFQNIETELENNKRIVEFGVRYYYGQTSSKLERLGDSIGLIANATKDGSAVVNDFDTKPIFKDIKEVKRHKTTHKLLSIKGDADYETTDGEVMIDFPDTYWKFEEAPDKTYLDIWLCNIAKTGYFKVEKFAIGKYPLSINEEGKLQTKSGTCAEGWKGLTTWRSLVKTEYGEGACLLDWRYDVFTALYLIEFADFNSQNVLGQGISTFRYNFTADKSLLAEENTNRVVINTAGGNAFIVGQQVIIGTTDGGFQIGKYRTITAKENYSSDGITGVAITVDGEPFTTTTEVAITSCAQKTGSADEIQSSSGSMSNDGKKASSYRGVEKNSIFDWVDGRNIRNGTIYECTNPENYASDFFDVPYEALTDYTIPQETNGYIKTLGFDKNHPFCRMQKEYGGGSSTHITDYGWSNPTGQFACRVGGTAISGAGDGLFYWAVVYSAGNAAWTCGARVLMYQI